MKSFVLELQKATLTGMPYGDKFLVRLTGKSWQQALVAYMETQRGAAYICNGTIAINSNPRKPAPEPEPDEGDLDDEAEYRHYWG